MSCSCRMSHRLCGHFITSVSKSAHCRDGFLNHSFFSGKIAGCELGQIASLGDGVLRRRTLRKNSRSLEAPLCQESECSASHRSATKPNLHVLLMTYGTFLPFFMFGTDEEKTPPTIDSETCQHFTTQIEAEDKHV